VPGPLLFAAAILLIASMAFSMFVALNDELRTHAWDELRGGDNCVVMDDGRLYCD
jgi:hypothetical protein